MVINGHRSIGIERQTCLLVYLLGLGDIALVENPCLLHLARSRATGTELHPPACVHAGLGIQPRQREKLERLCRYVSRPPIAADRLALTSSGQVRYALKTPYRDGTTHIVLEPLDLMARLAALVPPPRMHLTRFHGVFAPHSKLRAAVTPAHRGVGSKTDPANPDQPITPRHVAMSWAQRLKRVFGVEINTCARCGGKLKVIASIEEPEVIGRILAHLEKTAPDPQQAELPLGARAPPQQARLI